MDFELSDDDVSLKNLMRDLCRSTFQNPRDLSARDVWPQLSEAGVFSLRLPEDAGGAGLGTTQAVIVFEELGRALIPGPLVASHVAAGEVEGAATGDRIVGCAWAGDLLIDHAESLDDLVVIDPDGVSLVDIRTLDVRAEKRPLDPMTPVSLASSLGVGASLGGPELVYSWELEGGALTAALLVGIAAALCDSAVAYAKERKQFDRPIGSFQAVKHLCADMLVRAEIARAAVYAAGVMLDDPSSGDAPRAVAAAKLLANEAAVANGKACVQVHGGMGFTWEVDVHLYLKRAAVLATRFGTTHELEAKMAAYL